MENLYDLFWKSSDINGGNMMKQDLAQASVQENRFSLIDKTKGFRAIAIAQRNSDLLDKLTKLALEANLIRPDEKLILTIKNTRRTKYCSTPLSQEQAVAWLDSLLDSRNGYDFGHAATEHIRFLRRHADKSLNWWCDVTKPRRAETIRFIRGPFQQLLNKKAHIKARPDITTWRLNIKPEQIGFEVRLGQVVEVELAH